MSIKETLKAAGLFQTSGAWAIVDGQYGSTGKGLVAAVLAECFARDVDLVASNAGPNSGHTSYYKGEKIVLQQLPSFAVYARKMGYEVPVYMNGGAIIDVQRLSDEIEEWDMRGLVSVHAAAAMITPESKANEAHLVGNVGSTGKGTGGALAAKILRDPKAVVGGLDEAFSYPFDIETGPIALETDMKVLLEVSQGFSLSLNASGMYPYTTSRDCTVSQALADAGIHPHTYQDCVMVVRTYPIRVAGNSGPHYPDQKEITWDELGQTPEITTVTKKVRRVFTWSDEQFRRAVHTNRPGVVFVNFMNYLGEGVDRNAWLEEHILKNYYHVMDRDPKAVLLGYGPNVDDVELWEF